MGNRLFSGGLMKKLSAFLIVFLLAACIPVEDPGAFWDKAGVDTEMQGLWKTSGIEGDQKEVEEVYIYAQGKDLKLEEYRDGKKASEQDSGSQATIIRTLKIGPYRFLLAKDSAINMFRYEIKGKTLILYDEKPEAVRQFLAAHFPKAKDILVQGLNDPDGRAQYVIIKRFTDEVEGILSKIPDDQTYWIKNTAYEKIRQ